jgi:hypothetical protein
MIILMTDDSLAFHDFVNRMPVIKYPISPPIITAL